MQKNNAREQIIAKLKESDNILITVSNNPSVDELSAAQSIKQVNTQLRLLAVKCQMHWNF